MARFVVMSANDAEQMKKWWFRLSLVLLGTMPDAMREVFKVVWKRKFKSDFEPLSEESPTYKNVRQIYWNKKKKLEELRHLDDYVKKNLLKPVADMDVTALCTFLLNTNFPGPGRLVKFSSALGRQISNMGKLRNEAFAHRSKPEVPYFKFQHHVRQVGNFISELGKLNVLTTEQVPNFQVQLLACEQEVQHTEREYQDVEASVNLLTTQMQEFQFRAELLEAECFQLEQKTEQTDEELKDAQDLARAALADAEALKLVIEGATKARKAAEKACDEKQQKLGSMKRRLAIEKHVRSKVKAWLKANSNGTGDADSLSASEVSGYSMSEGAKQIAAQEVNKMISYFIKFHDTTKEEIEDKSIKALEKEIEELEIKQASEKSDEDAKPDPMVIRTLVQNKKARHRAKKRNNPDGATITHLQREPTKAEEECAEKEFQEWLPSATKSP